MPNFLFEILLEEVPHSILPKTNTHIQQSLPLLLKKYGLECSKIQFFATPRRFAFLIENLPQKGEDQIIEQKGPSLKVAYDDNKNPTRVLEGFLKSYNVSEKEIEIRDIKGQQYLFVSKKISGASLSEILPNLLSELIDGIKFNQPMRWNHQGQTFEFIRPVRGITAMIDSNILPVTFFGIQSSNELKGHRQLFPNPVAISNANEYESTLKQIACVPSFEERKNTILQCVNQIAQKHNAQVLLDEELLSILASLTEYPHPLLAEFDKEFLKLPKEVLISEMKVHQKYIPLVDKNDNLLPYYIITANMPHDDEHTKKNILAGNGRVLAARFADGRFFFDEDLKKGLEFYADSLKSVAFVDGAGSISDKVTRMISIAEYFRQTLAPTLDSNLLKQAVRLSKADLSSLMVGEFPELQGIIGAYYAEHLGLDPQVVLAIKEHYYPLNNTNPSQEFSALVGLADRVDNLLTLYAVGKTVTGSKDPYALRRQTIAIIHLITQFNWNNFSLNDLFTKLSPLYKEILTLPETQWKELLIEFISVRLESVLKTPPYEFQADLLNAGLSKGIDVINNDIERIQALQHIRTQEAESFARLIELAKRINNILKEDTINAQVDESLFEEQAEKDLYKNYLETANISQNLSFDESLKAIVRLETSIGHFFDSVMVRTGDNKEKNRVALLHLIRKMINNYADFSKFS